MSERRERRTADLGSVAPAGSRQLGRRSAVGLTEEAVVVGTADGEVRSYDRSTLDRRWRAEATDDGASVSAVVSFAGGVAVGERGPEGAVRAYDADGTLRWRYATASDVGPPQKETRFYLPFVAAAATGGGRLYAASRRYERDGDDRTFTSVVYAFDATGDVVWTHETDASPIALDARDDRVAVVYNRCPGTHRPGLVVLDAETGGVRYDWDPEGEGDRRVGDVSLVEDGAVVASHADYCGYRVRDDGTVAWRAELATPTEVGDERLYAYPNHVRATDHAAVFVTGNTYPTEGRETDSLHPDEHTAFGYAADGERAWSAAVSGFAGELAADGDRVAVPGAQHFRTRNADAHGLRVFDALYGPLADFETNGVVTAAALDDETVAAVEEPVAYHDEDRERGAYRLLVTEIA
jgi:outer membrane protein assembly factor BamB